MKDIRNIFLVFGYDLFGKELSSTTQFYRPIVNLSFFFDSFLGGEKPTFYHLTNIILHSLNSSLVYLLLMEILSDKRISFFSSFLFLILPLNGFVMCYISNRTVLLGSFFAYLSFLFFLDFIKLKARGRFFSRFSFIFFLCFQRRIL